MFSFIISIPVGIYSAIKKDTLFDHIVRATVTIVAALPTFFVALLLVFTFCYHCRFRRHFNRQIRITKYK